MKLIDSSIGFTPNHSSEKYCTKIEDFILEQNFDKIEELGNLINSMGGKADIVEADDVGGHVMCANNLDNDSPKSRKIMKEAAEKIGFPVPSKVYVNSYSFPDDPIVGNGNQSYRDIIGNEGYEKVKEIFKKFGNNMLLR